MEIRIQCEDDEGKVEIILSNEMLNNYNFVDLVIGETVNESFMPHKEITVPIDELYCAVIAFENYRRRINE